MFRSKRKPWINLETGDLIDTETGSDQAQPKRKFRAAIKNAAREAILRRTSTKG